jgi:hypothetical protein
MAKISRVPVSDTTDDNHYNDADSVDPVPSRRMSRNVTAVSAGWGAPVPERRETAKFESLVLGGKGKRIVKILDEVPAVKYGRHYIKSAGPKGKYYTCLNDEFFQGDCPLCAEGLRRSQSYVMNVVDLIEDPDKVVAWVFGNEVSTALQSLTENPQGDYWALNSDDRYFHVYHEKLPNRDAPATRVLPLKARDLEDDYGIQPLTESDLAERALEVYGEEIIFIPTIQFLANVPFQDSDKPAKRASN